MDLADAVKKHKKTYDDDDDDNDERSLGTAAAMQALKLFNKGETGSSGSGGQSAFLGLAMSEASKVSFASLRAASFMRSTCTNDQSSSSMPRLLRARSLKTPARSLPCRTPLRWL